MSVLTAAPGVAGVTDAVAETSEGRRKAEIREAAEAFEALFLQTLIKKMRESQLQDGLFGEGAGSSVYEGMFDQMLGERLAAESPLGIADSLEASWSGIPGKRAQALEALREAAAAAAKVRGAAADE